MNEIENATLEMNIPFFQAPNNIFELGIDSYKISVYLYLCRCSNHGSKAFPSYNTIAQKCGMSRRKAIDTVDELIKCNLIHKKLTKKKNNENNSNIYIVQSPSAYYAPPSAPDALPSEQYAPNKELDINKLDIDLNKKEENTVSVTSYYSNILGRKLTKPEMTALLNFKLDYSAELTIRAIDEMVLGNKGNSIKYLRTVLKDWHSKGLTTVESVDLYLSEREVKKSNKRKHDEKKRTEAAEHKNKKESSFQYSGQREYSKDLEKQLTSWQND